MKLKCLTLLLLLISSIPTYAQLELGVKTGFNVSAPYAEIYGTETDHYKSVFSFQIGIYTEYRFNEKYSINPELLLQNKGMKFYIFSDEIRYYDTYLSLPILFGFHPDKNFTILFGPEFSYSLLSGYEITVTNMRVPSLFRNKYDLGFSVGARQIFLRDFFVEIRYTHGLLDIHSGDETVMFNRIYQFSLGYRLKWKNIY